VEIIPVCDILADRAEALAVQYRVINPEEIEAISVCLTKLARTCIQHLTQAA
jgi:hypothetical protein